MRQVTGPSQLLSLLSFAERIGAWDYDSVSVSMLGIMNGWLTCLMWERNTLWLDHIIIIVMAVMLIDLTGTFSRICKPMYACFKVAANRDMHKSSSLRDGSRMNNTDSRSGRSFVTPDVIRFYDNFLVYSKQILKLSGQPCCPLNDILESWFWEFLDLYERPWRTRVGVLRLLKGQLEGSGFTGIRAGCFVLYWCFSE